MLRFWLVCFALLFVVVEIWEWLQAVTLALPFCVLGGILLAIVSNLKFISSPAPDLKLPSDPSEQ